MGLLQNMKKEELVEIFSNLHPEDTAGNITGEVHLADGTIIKTAIIDFNGRNGNRSIAG